MSQNEPSLIPPNILTPEELVAVFHGWLQDALDDAFSEENEENRSFALRVVVNQISKNRVFDKAVQEANHKHIDQLLKLANKFLEQSSETNYERILALVRPAMVEVGILHLVESENGEAKTTENYSAKRRVILDNIKDAREEMKAVASDWEKKVLEMFVNLQLIALKLKTKEYLAKSEDGKGKAKSEVEIKIEDTRLAEYKITDDPNSTIKAIMDTLKAIREDMKAATSDEEMEVLEANKAFEYLSLKYLLEKWKS